ncbi:hypothetical protein AVEN_270550-1 [Araneus ventricosus]|uniref:Uncharacterized protein n=1 Tax=Araneus ventricosus TaxID=182803 RepID=A0A4Y2B783_ARAVE|nr:hypothetical protein AVEN_270550-1 [Araneus ventricosus]
MRAEGIGVCDDDKYRSGLGFIKSSAEAVGEQNGREILPQTKHHSQTVTILSPKESSPSTSGTNIKNIQNTLKEKPPVCIQMSKTQAQVQHNTPVKRRRVAFSGWTPNSVRRLSKGLGEIALGNINAAFLAYVLLFTSDLSSKE